MKKEIAKILTKKANIKFVFEYLKQKVADSIWYILVLFVGLLMGWFGALIFGPIYMDKYLIEKINTLNTSLKEQGYSLLSRKWGDLHGFGNNSVVSIYGKLKMYNLDGHNIPEDSDLLLVIYDKNTESYVESLRLDSKHTEFQDLELEDVNDDGKNEILLYFSPEPGINHSDTALDVYTWDGGYKRLFHSKDVVKYTSDIDENSSSEVQEHSSVMVEGKEYDKGHYYFVYSNNNLFLIWYLHLSDGEWRGWGWPEAVSVQLIKCNFDSCNLIEDDIRYHVYSAKQLESYDYDNNVDIKSLVDRFNNDYGWYDYFK